ncbi:hypothetical protein BS17DRAFT_788371 [Gyrodon lividus]|nr:hypothetical protein BS17DRAFT_788371 [Gyrodon lividus]
MAELDRMLRAEFAGLSEMTTETDYRGLETALSSQTPQYWPRRLSSLFESAPLDISGYAPSHADLDSLSSSFGDSSVGSPLAGPSKQWASQCDVLSLFPTHRLGGGDVDHALDPLNIPLGMPPDGLGTFHDPPRTVHLSDVTLGGATIAGKSSLSAATTATAPLISLPTGMPKEIERQEDDGGSDWDLSYPSESDYSPPATGTSLTEIRPSRRKPRAMTKVPVPIPNFTKKSRGRKVPTSTGEPVYAHSRDRTKKGVRTYTCHAEGCGKCFVRGEHLKRHIRSIHTDEKPWKCTYNDCSRTFSRRDNLNQHLRIHTMQG